MLRTRSWALLWSWLAGALFVVGCAREGTETDNPVVDFGSSGCKGHGAALIGPDAGRDRSGHDNRACIAWDASETGALTVRLFNYNDDCVLNFTNGHSALKGDALTLRVRNDNGCSGPSACLPCYYDLSFELRATFAAKPLALAIEPEDCKGKLDATWPTWMTTLPLDREKTGTLCRNDAGKWQAFTEGDASAAVVAPQPGEVDAGR